MTKQTVRKGMTGKTVTCNANSNYPGAKVIVTGYVKYDDGSLGYEGHYVDNPMFPADRVVSFDDSLLEVA